MKKTASIFVVMATLYGCSTAPVKQPAQASSSESPTIHAQKGLQYIQSGLVSEAIIEFDEAIKLCETQYPADGKKIYTSRTTAESLMYSIQSTNNKESAEVVDTLCSDAYYIRGSIALNTGRIRDAEFLIKKAVSMAPMNSMYLSALGHIYQVRREWNLAVDYFTQAEAAAPTYSPDALKANEYVRAKRGVGFNLIQLGKLNEAEVKYKECLALNSGDKSALDELEYINIIRGKTKL
jgi:Tfp pilus assembly protein PilF